MLRIVFALALTLVALVGCDSPTDPDLTPPAGTYRLVHAVPFNASQPCASPRSGSLQIKEDETYSLTLSLPGGGQHTETGAVATLPVGDAFGLAFTPDGTSMTYTGEALPAERVVNTFPPDGCQMLHWRLR